MAIKVTCDTCLTVYNLADNKAGTRMTCRKCEASIRVPGRARVEEVEEIEEVEEVEEVEEIDAIPVEEDEPTLVAPLDDEEAEEVEVEAIQSGRTERHRRNEAAFAEDRPVRSRKSRDEEEDEGDRPRNRRRPRADEDEEDEDERPKKRNAMPLILGAVAGGVVLLVALGGTLAWALMDWTSETTSTQAQSVRDPDEDMKRQAVEPRVVARENPPEKPRAKEQPKEVVFPPPPPPPSNPLAPPKDIQEALARLREPNPDRQKTASDWLQLATLSDFYRNEVAKALDPLLNNQKTKLSALLALARWGTRDNLDSLHPLLGDTDGTIWRPAFDTLAMIKDEKSVDPVGKYLPDDAKGISAEKVLRLIGKKGEPQALKYIHHKTAATRARAGGLLQSYGTTNGTILDQTIQDIQGTDQDMRNWALQDRVLSTVDPSRQAKVSKALEGLLTDANSKQKALSALQIWATTDNVPGLIGVLADAQLKRNVMELLGKLKDGRAARPLALLLGSPTDRGDASRALQKIGSPAEQGVLALMPNLVTAPDPATRHEAFNVIGHIGTRASLPLLNGYLKVPALKGEATTAIRKIVARGG
jgi:HEAT repeat protein